MSQTGPEAGNAAVAPKNSAQLKKYLRDKQKREKFQFISNAIATVLGSNFYGLVFAMLPFTLAYFGSSAIGGMAGQLTVGFVSHAFKMMMPFSFLVPYSNFILLGAIGSITAANLIYAYRTGTHGFEMPTTGSMVRSAAHAAPWVTFFAGLYLGFTPISAFKATWLVGGLSSLGLCTEVLVGMYAKLKMQEAEDAPLLQEELPEQPKDPKTKDNHKMPSQRFDGTEPKLTDRLPSEAVVQQYNRAQANADNLAQRSKKAKETQENAPSKPRKVTKKK